MLALNDVRKAMASDTAPRALSPASRQRQKARPICDECRDRKLRCDGQQPRCGSCQQLDVACEATHRGSRGPQKGYLKALRNRVMHLEAMLETRLRGQEQPESTGTNNNMLPTPPAAIDSGMLLSESSVIDFGPLPEWPLLSILSPSTSTSSMTVTNAMHAELDQLFFDRVHPSIPILHQRQYLCWSKSGSKSAARKCLQSAMWLLAALLSSAFRDIVEPLYRDVKQRLESVGFAGDGGEGCEIELVQAWVLIAMYESMQANHRQAWMSVGLVFRMVQAIRFHEIDSPKNINDNNFVILEERRRVFWMAYLIDHLISMRSDWPITLNEHVICTRLPAPDKEFQNSENVVAGFLSEAMTETSPKVLSPFNECLIFATICGRSLLRGQQYHISMAYGGKALDAAGQRRWLVDILRSRLQILLQWYPSATGVYDPLLLFANVLAQATIVYHCKGVMELSDNCDAEAQDGMEVIECENWALDAGSAIIRLANLLSELHFSKVHPLMPLPLFLTAEFLYNHRFRDEPFMLRLRELMATFRELKNVNNLEQSYMDLLPQLCIKTTARIVEAT